MTPIPSTGGTSSAAPPPILELTAIAKAFGGVRALRSADLAVQPGTVHALLGENGAGKSTLVNIMAGVFPPDSGEMSFAGAPVEHLDIQRSSRLGIRVIYQKLSTVPHLTVEQNLTLGREPARWGVMRRRAARRQAADALARVGATMDLDRQAGTLPVAERQLIEIARALQGDCRLLVMDEPTASLGELEVEHLFGVVRSLRDEGVAVIFISHKLAEVRAIAQSVTVLRDGQSVGTVSAADASERDLIEMMVGRDLHDGLQVTRAVPSDEVTLRVDDLWTTTGLQGVSFELYRGEVLGVYGLMGSGRTELARALFGADRPTAGTITLDGTPVSPRSPADAKRLGMGLVPEERPQAVFYDLSVRSNISSASGDLISRAGVVRRALEGRLASGMVQALAVRTPSIEAPLRSLSGGNQQKVVLGRWLMRDADLLILDDPTSGVDVGAKNEIYRLIVEQTERGASVLMSSSELPELLAIANRIIVLRAGRVVGILSGDRLTQSDVLDLAFRGTDPRDA
ncbi:MAG: sugar ABC transporter ATP-binding protein [Chloroflexi bacterium]|nr:sugar ABC transporter ATP-binding protein [Chloroflexota bacterium]